MFERFSDGARRAVREAEEQVRQLGHPLTGTEHLLLGIMVSQGSRAATALTAAGVTVDGCRSKVIEAVGVSDEPRHRSRAAEIEFTERATRALERADRLSLRRRDDRVECEHVLLSVLDVEGRAGQVLRGLDVDLAALRSSLLSALETAPAGAAGAARVALDPEPPARASAVRDAVGPVCGSCGARLDTALAHRTIMAAGEAGDERGFIVAYCSGCGVVVGATALARR